MPGVGNPRREQKRFNRRRRLALAALLALVVAASAYAFTASNTVPNSSAGEGSGTISGFTASSIHYTLDAANPANITGVSFTLAPAAGATVRAALNYDRVVLRTTEGSCLCYLVDDGVAVYRYRAAVAADSVSAPGASLLPGRG